MYRGDISITALGALAFIFAAFLASGANSGALAGYFGAGLLVLALIKIMIMRPDDAARLINTHWVSLFAALAFITVGALSVAPSTAGIVRVWLDEIQLTSLSPYRTIEGLAAFTAPIAAFVLGASVERRQRSFVAHAIFIFAIAFAAWALINYAPAENARLSARLGSANTAACLFCMIGAFAAAHLVRAMRRGDDSASGIAGHMQALVRDSPLALAALALSAICLVLTLSRGGLVAAGAAFAVLAAFILVGGRAPLSRIWILLLGTAALLGGGAFIVMQRALLSAAALGHGDAISFDTRQTLIEIYWREFLERPLFGHGLNTYHELAALNADPTSWEALRTSGSVHNIYVQSLAESGAVGLALLSLTIAPALWRGVRRASSGDEWAAGAVASCVVCLVQGLADFGLQTPAIAALLAFVLGAFVKTSPSHREHAA